MQFKRRIGSSGTGVVLKIPTDIERYMNLKPKDPIIIQIDKSKHGEFISFWKDEGATNEDSNPE